MRSPNPERKGTYVFSNMPELGNNWDTRGTLDNGEDHQGERAGQKECNGSLTEMLSETMCIPVNTTLLTWTFGNGREGNGEVGEHQVPCE